MMSLTLLGLILPVCSPASPSSESLDRISLRDGEWVEGVVLTADENGVVVDVVSPESSSGLRYFAAEALDGPLPAPPAAGDWESRWRAQRSDSDADDPDGDVTLLLEALETADAARWRYALSRMKVLIGNCESDAEIDAIDRLVQLRTQSPLPEFMADLQLRTAADAMERSAFRIWYRATIESDVLATRLDQIHERLLEIVVPDSHDPENLARFLLMADEDDDIDADPPKPTVDLNPPRAHSINAWLNTPEHYDGNRTAARRMQQRIIFALQILKARLNIAQQQHDEEDEKRVLAERARLDALREAVQNRANGALTPTEREARRREAEEAAREAYEAEMERRGGGSDDDCEDGRGREGRRADERRGRDPR